MSQETYGDQGDGKSKRQTDNPGWKYYNHAMLPDCAPHETADMGPLENGSIWRKKRPGGGTVLLARWTSAFDCGYETKFWYCIKDDVFDIGALKAKRRYEITKGRRYFSCRKIRAADYTEAIADVLSEAAQAYPDAYRQETDRERVKKEAKSWDGQYVVFGAFDSDGLLSGYAYLKQHAAWSEFMVLKTRPSCERLGVNAALVACILEEFQDELRQGHYICDGTRPVSHETNFQDYLEKYFGFRKAFCHLHIRYRFGVKWIVSVLYIFRNIIKKHDNRLTHRVIGILRMEEMAGNGKRKGII